MFTVASLCADKAPASGYLFGYLRARVDHFLKGIIDRDELEHTRAVMELVFTMSVKYTPDEIRQFAAGQRELPGEDVQSGQSR